MQLIKNEKQYIQKLHPKITNFGQFCYDIKTDSEESDWDMMFVVQEFIQFDLPGMFCRQVWWCSLFNNNTTIYCFGHKSSNNINNKTWADFFVKKFQRGINNVRRR